MKGADVTEIIEHIETIRDLESFLRDAGGLSKGAAVALTARAKVILGQGEPDHKAAEAKALADLAERFQTPIFVVTDLDLGMQNWSSKPSPNPTNPEGRGKRRYQQHRAELRAEFED